MHSAQRPSGCYRTLIAKAAITPAGNLVPVLPPVIEISESLRKALEKDKELEWQEYQEKKKKESLAYFMRPEVLTRAFLERNNFRGISKEISSILRKVKR